ncbi:MAG TPA: DNA-3-methyladenine glycosylase 2 family protein [Azospira sp.]|nr:DNA-3-methyladenine glycosylase 2 family protein [Azospira sp.]
MKPDYWERACRDLAARDGVMAELVVRYAGFSLVSRGDAFATLARSIVGQQISVKAADAVWRRFSAALPEVAPETVLAAGTPGLQGVGLSVRKIEYLLDLAGRFADGRLQPKRWHGMGDAAVMAELCAVRGIGVWTAEMFLIFTLLRPDVFPLDDKGLQKAVARHYRGGAAMTRAELAAQGECWRPWRSVATWYLWRSLDPVPVEY